MSSWIHYSRNLERLQKAAEQEDPELEDIICELEKENSDLRLVFIDLEMSNLQIQDYSKNSLTRLFKSKEITELQIKTEQIITKIGSLSKIESKISKNKIQLNFLQKNITKTNVFWHKKNSNQSKKF